MLFMQAFHGLQPLLNTAILMIGQQRHVTHHIGITDPSQYRTWFSELTAEQVINTLDDHYKLDSLVKLDLPIEAVRKALQDACDNGMAGWFHLHSIGEGTMNVVFERQTNDDWCVLLQRPGVSPEMPAMTLESLLREQLAEELTSLGDETCAVIATGLRDRLLN